MLKNYFKIAWRNIKRHKAYSIINILGLALGIACVILIFTIVKYHLSFDNFHNSNDRIYRVITELHNNKMEYNTGVPFPFANMFRSRFPVTEKVARLTNLQKKLLS